VIALFFLACIVFFGVCHLLFQTGVSLFLLLLCTVVFVAVLILECGEQ
jgi:hypothetical protein